MHAHRMPYDGPSMGSTRIVRPHGVRDSAAACTAPHAVAPALPVGVAAGVADAVVVHPLTQVDEAWRDTLDVLWDYDQSSSFRQVLLTPLSVLATPLVFAGDWFCRAVFDLGGAEVVDAETTEEPGR